MSNTVDFIDARRSSGPKGPTRRAVPQLEDFVENPVPVKLAKPLQGPLEEKKEGAPWAVPSMAKLAGITLEEGKKVAGLRPCNANDFAELLPWSVEKYLQRFPRLTEERALSWLMSNLPNPKVRMVRTDNAWGVFSAYSTFFEPDITVSDVFVTANKAKHWEAMAIYEDAVKWAKGIGAVEVILGSVTGVDITPFAKRLGFAPKHTAHVLKLK